MKCPGQDTRYWKPEDIYDLPCPACGAAIEFLKTDSRRTCANCRYSAANARLRAGCAQWCAHGRDCVGGRSERGGGASILEAR